MLRGYARSLGTVRSHAGIVRSKYFPTLSTRASSSSSADDSVIRVVVNDKEQTLPAIWLRLNDPGGITANGQRTFEIADIVNCEAATSILRHRSSDCGGLHIEWADGTTSHFSHTWLAARTQPNAEQSQQHLWNGRFDRFLPEVDGSDLLLQHSADVGKRPPRDDDDAAINDAIASDARLRVCSFLARYGFALVRNVPLRGGMVKRMGNAIGHVRTTNYGDVFDVIDRGTQASNLADTTLRINAHLDNPYRDPYPGVQLLHCLQQAPGGDGATRLTDGFAAAEALRRADPAAFRLLASHHHPFEYRDASAQVLLRTRAPVLTLDHHTGAVERVCYNNRSAGCLPPDSMCAAEMRSYYAAWAAFDALCNADAHTIRLTLQPGDLVIFDNARVMHGREQYAAGAARHLQGCYIDRDAVRSVVAASTKDASSEPCGGALSGGAGPDMTCTTHRFDVHAEATEDVLQALATQADFHYGEGLSMLEHALQAADCAQRAGASAEAVIASLVHDVGNTPQARDVWTRDAGGEEPRMLYSPNNEPIGYARHADMGGAYLRHMGFAEAVSASSQMHVSAKRALVAADPTYMKVLSQASIDTLRHQGGPLTPRELESYYERPGAQLALEVRRYDDEAKEPGKQVPRLEAYREVIYRHLVEQSSAI